MANKRRKHARTWSSWPLRRRVALSALGALELALLVAAERDIHVRSASEINGRKAVWRVICLINIVGPLSYFRWGPKRS